MKRAKSIRTYQAELVKKFQSKRSRFEKFEKLEKKGVQLSPKQKILASVLKEESDREWAQILADWEQPINTMVNNKYNFYHFVDDVKQHLRLAVFHAARQYSFEHTKANFATYCYKALRNALVNQYAVYAKTNFSKMIKEEVIIDGKLKHTYTPENPFISLQSAVGHGEDQNMLQDLVADEGSLTPEEHYAQDAPSKAVQQLLNKLPEGIEKKIVTFFIQGKTINEIAKLLHYSHTRIRFLIEGGYLQDGKKYYPGLKRYLPGLQLADIC